MKKRFYLAILLLPATFILMLWFYPSSLIALNDYEPVTAILITLILSFTASYSISLFYHTLIIGDKSQ